MASPNSALVRFIRSSLGCECPDETLADIGLSNDLTLPGWRRPVTRINVGGRLLVYVTVVDRIHVASPAVVANLEAGIDERDRNGFNRFRLVLASTSPGAVEARGRNAFDAYPPPDDRVHLHVVDVADVPKPVLPKSS